jgi:hypothetical protein
MFTKSTTMLRRLSGYAITALISSACLSAGLTAQSPLVVSSTLAAIPHNETYGAPWQAAVSNRGDFLLFDFKTGGLYEFPANGGPEITIGAPNVLSGGFTDSGIAVDLRNNNIYINNNYNGGLQELPFDTATGLWDLPPVTVASGLAGNLGGSCGNYFQSAGMAMNHNGVLAVATENGCGVEIFTVPIDTAGNFGSANPIVANMKARARTVAIDDAGNISYTEDAGLAGVLFIPAGVTGLNGETSVSRVDPNLGNVQGVAVDNAGNLIVADGSTGEYLVPLESGVPNPAHTVYLSSAPAQGNAAIDQPRGVLFLPTGGIASIKDVIRVYLNRAELGTAAVGKTGATATTVYYNFSGAVTPHTFVVQEAGATADFVVGTTGSCVADTAYAANGSCTVSVNFTPHTAGDISATLAMVDKNGNVLASTVLHGVGQASSIVMAPATESVIGSALKTPTQVATDAFGNVYIADGGQGKVLQYAKGSGATSTPVSVGTGLTAPTGVAIDGGGDVFIADSGNVIEVPYGSTGLNVAGQAVLKGGFGAQLTLAADGIGDIFVSDPANQRVAKLRVLVDSVAQRDITGFTQLTAIAADGSGDLFVANGQNLIEVPAFGPRLTLLTTLPTGVNGLAVDASGSVYVSSSSGTIRIPNEAGTLNPAHQTTIASGVTKPASVAVDTVGNAYVADSTAKNVDFVNANGALNLGTLTTTTATSTGIATIANDGNLPLNITGFTGTADFTETATTCIGAPIAVGSTCTATITFNPGPGDQGSLSGKVLVLSDAGNAPIGINAIGVGATLAASTTSLTVTKPTVTNDPVVVTVASKSGTGATPTGNVTLTITATGATPVTITKPLASGAVTFNPTGLKVGAYTFTVAYAGDRVYGTSSASTTASITAGTVILVQPLTSAVPIYVLANGSGAQEPYDNSQVPFYYNYPLVVQTADGSPLLGVPILNAGGVQLGVDYGLVSFVGAGGVPVCSGSSATVNVNADGTAPFGTQCFSIDTSNNQIPNLMNSYTFTPVYTGHTDPNYGTVTGTPVTVIALRNPMVIITSNPSTINVTAGTPATATLTLTSLLGFGVTGVSGNLNNYSLPVELECDALPAHAACSFSYPTPDPSDPNSTDVTPTTPGKVIMTIITNAPVGTSTSSLRQGSGETALAAIFGFGLLGICLRRKRSIKALTLMAVCVSFLGAAVMGMTSCSSKQLGAAPTLTTPAGTYSVTVTAKQTGSKMVQAPGQPIGTLIPVYGSHNQMSIPFSVSVVVK